MVPVVIVLELVVPRVVVKNLAFFASSLLSNSPGQPKSVCHTGAQTALIGI